MPDLELDRFLTYVQSALRRDWSPDQSRTATLLDLGLDSLDLVELNSALLDEYGDFDLEAGDGLIDPAWTLADLHHLMCAGIERKV